MNTHLNGKVEINKIINFSMTVDTKGNVYLFGGLNPDLSMNWKLIRFTLKSKSWEVLSDSMLEGRYFHSLNISGQYLFVYGGKNNQIVFSDFVVFDLRTRLWSQIVAKTSPGSRYGHTGFIYKKCLYLVSGRSRNEIFNDIWKFDIKRMNWMLCKPAKIELMSPLYHCSSILFGDYAFILFGLKSEKVSRFTIKQVLDSFMRVSRQNK